MEIILLIGHGSQTNETEGIEQVAEHLHNMIHSDCKKSCIRIAYLQFIKPSIKEAIKDSVQKGAKKIIVHPYFLHSGVHVTENIPRIIKEAGGLYPDVEFVCTQHLGVHHKLAEVVLERIKEATDLEGGI